MTTRLLIVAGLLGGVCVGAVLASDPVPGSHEETGHTDAAHAEAPPSIMKVDPGLLVWTWITFVVLLVVLRFTAWKPLMSALDAREQRIRNAIEGAEKARQESDVLLEQHRRKLVEAQDEAARILEAGQQDALRVKEEILAQSRSEAEEFKARSRREIELATDEAKRELWVHATQISTELAQKILRRSLDDGDHRRLVGEVLDEYRAVRSGDSS